MLRQRTLKTAARTTGVGLHTGARVDLVLRPAAVDAGVVFHRTDLAGSAPIPATATVIGDTRLSSTLRVGEAGVSAMLESPGARGAGSPARRPASPAPDAPRCSANAR